MKKSGVAALAWIVLLSAVGLSAAADGADLLKAVATGDEKARLEAIDTLGRTGENLDGAVPALIGQLGDPSATIRAHAAHALGQIGPTAKPAAETLAGLAGDEDVRVRREAVRAYRSIAPGPEVSIPLFTKLFEDSEPEVRIHIMDALAEAGKEAVPGMIRALENRKATYWACLVLAEIGSDAEAAVPALEKLLQTDDRPEVCREAILALAAIGPGAAGAVPSLIKVLDEKEPINDGPVVYALGAIGPKAKAAEPIIRKLANDEASSPFLRTVSLWALARMNPDDKELAKEVIPRLIDALKAPAPRLRAAAARALIDLDPDPEVVRPLMKKAMDDASPEMLNDVMHALSGLGEEAVPRLIGALGAKEVRARAAAILARIGPPAKAAVPALIEALSDENAETRGEILLALAAIGPEAKAAVPAAGKALQDEDMNVRYAACYALGQIGPAAMPAKPRLLKNLGGPDQFLSMASAWALCRIQPASAEICRKAVPVLTEALAEPDTMTRVQAIESLKLLGPHAKDARGALEKALKDPDEAVRGAAAEALEALGK
ncbi:MAG: HEAT repeat domain-containing protein [Pirellulales bacterium]|nr:HEAT repeat domain-containing protein [Pirellulales bacterium]